MISSDLLDHMSLDNFGDLVNQYEQPRDYVEELEDVYAAVLGARLASKTWKEYLRELENRLDGDSKRDTMLCSPGSSPARTPRAIVIVGEETAA